MTCTAPDCTATVSVLAAAAASEMIWLWAESSGAPSARSTLRARSRNWPWRILMNHRRLRLLNDRLKVQRTCVVAGHRCYAGQVQAQVELIRPGTEIATRGHGLAEQLE